jgi:hypothetical protein
MATAQTIIKRVSFHYIAKSPPPGLSTTEILGFFGAAAAENSEKLSKDSSNCAR